MGNKCNVEKERSVICVRKLHQIKLTSISGSILISLCKVCLISNVNVCLIIAQNATYNYLEDDYLFKFSDFRFYTL